jgi:hypothetical protein
LGPCNCVKYLGFDGTDKTQAYVLAKKNTLYERFVKRIHSIYFLATPHRGSNMAQVLSRFLMLGMGMVGPKKFVGELIPGCSTLEVSNCQVLREESVLDEADN